MREYRGRGDYREGGTIGGVGNKRGWGKGGVVGGGCVFTQDPRLARYILF